MYIIDVVCGKLLSHSLQSWNDDKIGDRSRAHNYLYSIIEISCVLDVWQVIRINFHAYRASHVMREICSFVCVARQVFLYFFYETRINHNNLLAWPLITYDNTLVSESVDLGIGVNGSSRYKISTQDNYLRPRWASQIWHLKKCQWKSQKS